MVNRLGCAAIAACAILAGSARPALAQQTLNFTFGYFTPTAEDARVDGDILTTNRSSFVFDVKDFNSASVGGEWLVALGNYLEAGAGVSFSRRTVPSVYSGFVNTDGSEIEQDFRLRMIPVAFTMRVVPTGQSSVVQPYFGGGISFISWEYRESGEFIDRNRAIFRDTFVATGNATGPVVLGGIRFGSDTVSAGGEVRFQKADADFDANFAGVANPSIDLGGWTYLVNVGMRFGR